MIESLRRPVFSYLGWLLLSFVFLLSVIGKLYPTPANGIEIFENDYLIPILPSWITSDFVSILSRSLIALESFFVIAFILPSKDKKVIGIAAIFLLLVFCFHLLIQYVNNSESNCGCFGQLIEMTPLQAILKNVLTIFLIAFLLWLGKKEKVEFSLVLNLLFFFICFSFIYIITPASISIEHGQSNVYTPENVLVDKTSSDSMIYIGLDLNLNNRLEYNEQNQEIEILFKQSKSETKPIEIKTKGPSYIKSIFRDVIPGIDLGRKIICYYDPTCSHCILTHKKLKEISKIKRFPSVHIIFAKNQTDKIPEFWEITDFKTPFSIITEQQQRDFVFVKPRIFEKPSIYFLYNGNILFNYIGGEDHEIDLLKLKKAIEKEF